MTKIMMIAAATALCFSSTAMANETHMQAKAEHCFKKMDADGNGTVSKAENSAFGEKMFRDADTNHNNMLTVDEVKAKMIKDKEEFKSAHPNLKKSGHDKGTMKNE